MNLKWITSDTLTKQHKFVTPQLDTQKLTKNNDPITRMKHHQITRQLNTRKLADDDPLAHFLQLQTYTWMKCRTHQITHQLDTTRKLPKDDDPYKQLRWLNPQH